MGKQRGFTIVELILFIAISGLLLMVAMSGVSGSIRTNRMTDTVRSFQSFIEAQISDVSSGVVRQNLTGDKLSCVSPIPKYPGASDDCIVIGKLLTLTTGATPQLKTYNVVGNIKPDSLNCAPAATGVAKLRQYCPRVLDMSEPSDVYVPEWSAAINAIQFIPHSSPISSSKNSLAILRDPTSDFVYVSAFNQSTTTGQLDMKSSTILDPDFTNSRGVICLNMGGFPALKSHVLFGGGSGTGSIRGGGDAALPAGLSCP